jgi:hypothetical protein
MESEGLLTPTQVHATCHYPEPAQSSPYPIPLFEHPPIYVWVSQVVSFPQASPPKPCIYTPILSPTHATYPAHFILLNFIIWKLLGKEYRSLSSSLCSFLHSLVTSSLS